MNCNEATPNFPLYVYGELPPSSREAIEAHVAGCEACRANFEQTRRLHSLMSERTLSDPSPELLVKCRQRLETALDREPFGWRRLFTDWYAVISNPSRVATALTLVLLGFGLGWMIRPRAGRMPQRSNPSQQLESSVAGSDLGSIGSISQVSPDPQTDKVRITLNAEHRVTLDGSLDNPRIRNILVGAVRDTSNPGIRLDTLDALKQKPNNPSIEDALLYTLVHDPNAGVRLAALRSVPGMSWNSKVQSALVSAVQQDANPGVRVAAIDDLVKHAIAQHDQSLLPALQSFGRSESNAYVRGRALTAVRELERGN